jgi:hypothetical protein
VLRPWRERRLENAEAGLADWRERRRSAMRFGRHRRTLECSRVIERLERKVARLESKLSAEGGDGK